MLAITIQANPSQGITGLMDLTHGLVPRQHLIPIMNNNSFIDDENIPMKISDVPTIFSKRDHQILTEW